VGKDSRAQTRWLRHNGAGIDPKIGVPAHELTFGRLPDGGVRCAMKNDRGRVLASIDWDPTDVRAARDALTQVLITMKG
jgi:hypothetical protein